MRSIKLGPKITTQFKNHEKKKLCTKKLFCQTLVPSLLLSLYSEVYIF